MTNKRLLVHFPTFNLLTFCIQYLKSFPKVLTTKSDFLPTTTRFFLPLLSLFLLFPSSSSLFPPLKSFSKGLEIMDLGGGVFGSQQIRLTSVSLHFNADPDPDLRIRFRDKRSGSDLKSNKFQLFSVKNVKIITMFFLLLF